MEEALDIVNNSPTIKTVILAPPFRRQASVNSKKCSFVLLGYKNENNLVTLNHLLTQTVEELVKNRKKVVLLLDVPTLSINIKNCQESRPFQEAVRVCSFPEGKKKTNDD